MQYDMIEAVLARPKMYTLSGTFGEVVAFLEGYFSGMAKAKEAFPGKYDWTCFLDWLAIGLGSNQKPIVDTFRDRWADESLERLKEHYLEFKSQIGPDRS